MEASGTYLYAVTSTAGLRSPENLQKLAGVRDGKVYTIDSRDLTAVVSDVATEEELRPERRNLAAHQKVLGEVISSSQVALPVAFGTIADSPDGVRKLLDRYHDDLTGQLGRVEGKQQMGMRLTYAGAGNIFEFLVALDPALREARDTLQAAGDAATREQKIDVGQRFEAALDTFREEQGNKLADLLQQACTELKRLPPRNEQELARFACLVSREQQDEWDEAIDAAAKEFPDFLALEPSGPFPPYDFVELHLQA